MKSFLYFILFFLLSMKFIQAHEMSQTEALSILKKMNIEYSVEAMCEAAENDDVKIIELFHRSGASLETECSPWGDTLLFNAVDRVSERVYRYLIDNGADINNYSKYNYKTVFVEVLSNSRYDWAYELLNLGVDTRQKKPDEEGLNDMTAIGYTLLECDNSMLKAVLRNGASPNESNGIQMMLSMVPRNCSSMLMTLIKAGADVNLHKGRTDTPLIYYVIDSNNEYVKILLENGADTNIITNGRDAAFWAVSQNNYDILLTLNKYNADLKKIYLIDKLSIPFSLQTNKKLVEKLSSQGLTLLEIADAMGFSEIYNFLLKEQGIAS